MKRTIATALALALLAAVLVTPSLGLAAANEDTAATVTDQACNWGSTYYNFGAYYPCTYGGYGYGGYGYYPYSSYYNSYYPYSYYNYNSYYPYSYYNSYYPTYYSRYYYPSYYYWWR